MIDKTYFINKLQELKTLMNTQITKDFAETAYERIRTSYEKEDLDFATSKMLDGTYTRVTFPVLLSGMNEARGRRIDKESRIRQETEDRDTRMFWDSRKDIPYEPCLNHQCGSCPPDKWLYCEDIARATMAAIKEKFSMDNCPWSIVERLAKEFPGAGFEKDLKPKKWMVIHKDGTREMMHELPSQPVERHRTEWDRVEEMYDGFVHEE